VFSFTAIVALKSVFMGCILDARAGWGILLTSVVGPSRAKALLLYFGYSANFLALFL
jgi:hypothetical protein